MQYLKKARGTIRAVSTVELPEVTTDTDIDVTADCLDREGNGGRPRDGPLASRADALTAIHSRARRKSRCH